MLQKTPGRGKSTYLVHLHCRSDGGPKVGLGRTHPNYKAQALHGRCNRRNSGGTATNIFSGAVVASIVLAGTASSAAPSGCSGTCAPAAPPDKGDGGGGVSILGEGSLVYPVGPGNGPLSVNTYSMSLRRHLLPYGNDKGQTRDSDTNAYLEGRVAQTCHPWAGSRARPPSHQPVEATQASLVRGCPAEPSSDPLSRLCIRWRRLPTDPQAPTPWP